MSAPRNEIVFSLKIKNFKLKITILLRSNKIVDTPVVHALNDVLSLFGVSTL